ncbi:spore coat protein X [Geomicrobium halophilum]|uniref:Spore coat protein X n=1 Tax=Geomicrobium halophilum TaxID=549000 RepID=A0A841PRJ7_9BACL|nr:spore coat protein [Geomicrobium halophilum]MBB6448911.1 spore coat protein X [Geomicrobium halophilum]
MHLGQDRYSRRGFQDQCYQDQCYQDQCYQDDKRWSALYDGKNQHPMACFSNDDDITQQATQANKTIQTSEDFMMIKDSCDVTVTSTDTQAAVNLQLAIQAAIVLVVRIAIGSSSQAEDITQELLQTSKMKQRTSQKTIVENSRNIDVSSTDTQIALNIQVLVQLLVAIVVALDILSASA